MFLICFGFVNFNIKDTIKSFFPVITGNYWFVSAYIGMYILVPYMNKLIANLNRRNYRQLMFILFSVLPYIKNTSVNIDSGTVVYLIYIYFIGEYIRKYSNEFDRSKNKFYILAFLLSIFAMIVSIAILDLFNYKSWDIFIVTRSPFQIVAGTSLFLIMKNINISYNKIINYVAASTFAVYLLHCQLIFLPVLWNEWIKAQKYQNVAYTFLYEIVIACGIYVIATLIDCIRRSIVSIVKK